MAEGCDADKGDRTAITPTDTTALEWIESDLERDVGAASEDSNSRVARRTFLLSVGALLLASALFVVALASGADYADGEQSAADTERPSASNSSESATPVGPKTPEVPLVDQLASAPEEWVASLVIAWVDDQGELRARELSSGADLPLSTFAETNTPPLPDHVHLIGGVNGTWLLDLENPERSGEFSNTVRIVRMGRGLDSYGFSSVDEEGNTGFFVGTLWGPAMNGLAEVDPMTEVIAVSSTGFVVAASTGESASLRGSSFEVLPSRLGRVVAATSTLVAGIHCDAVGRCVGRVSDWEGHGERVVDVVPLSQPVVRISPNGRYIIAGGTPNGDGSTLHLIDLAKGGHTSWTLGITPDDSLHWSPDSSTAFFVFEGAVVAIRVEDSELKVRRVRSAGDLGDHLAGSDVRLFEDEDYGS